MIRTVIIACLLGAAAGTPWSAYLKSHNSKSFNWIAACKSLGQQASGYGSSGNKITLTCDHKIHIVCSSSSCTSSYKPPAASVDTPPPGKYNIKAPAAKCTGFSSKQVQDFLNLHNKMRCAVGAEPVHWDTKLECQAQAASDKIRAFSHSNSYKMKISAGENIATGKDPAGAAFMWFTEYLQSTDYAHGGETGHFSAMSWKSVTKIGCAVGSGGKDGVVRCQYAGSTAPNMAGAYGANLDKFYGTKAAFAKCGMSIAEIAAKAKTFKGWGILHPTGQMASNAGLYSVTDAIWSNASPAAFFSACAFIGAMAMVTIAVAVRRRRSHAQEQTVEDRELLVVEAGDEGEEGFCPE